MKKRKAVRKHLKNEHTLSEFAGDAWRYLKASRGYVLSSLLVFLIAGIFGFFASEHLSFLNPMIQEIFAKTENLSGLALTAFIFYNNVLSSFFGLFMGTFFGVISFFNVLLNGTVVGYVLALAAPTHGLGIAWRLVPHGIFELPAIFIATGLGMKLGLSFFHTNWKTVFRQRFVDSVKVFFVIVVPLLIIAALIEGLLITFSS
jgi:uncharacterized membrane protein SpoIIM required for sporulation